MKTDAGQSSFAVLLFQDIAVIPMLAIVPFLALETMSGTVYLQQVRRLLMTGRGLLDCRYGRKRLSSSV